MTQQNMPLYMNVRGRLLDLAEPQVMGILNLTPDSFYAESRIQSEKAVRDRAREIIDQGGSIIDVGACSTRPGAAPVSAKEEMERLRFGLEIIRREHPEAIVSVDTFRADVAQWCVEEYGADIINDISGGEADERMFDTVARLGVPYILMHMQGTPQTMQDAPSYENLLRDIFLYFARKVQQLRDRGAKDIVLDPGFGFGKTLAQNYELMGSATMGVKEGCGRSLCHDAPFGIDQLGAKHQGGRRRLAIVHGGAHRQAGMVLGHFIGSNVSAPLRHVHGTELAQPHVAVDAAPGVPARVGLLGIVHPHGQHVFGSPLQVGRQVVAERDVSVGARAQRMAVDVDGAVHVHAIKVYVEAFALVRLVHGKGFAVPAHASGQRASASARRIVFRKIALDGPIVRQVQLPPLRVVVGGLRGIGNIAKPECPAGGKVLPAAIALFFPGRHGGTRTCQQKYGQDR